MKTEYKEGIELKEGIISFACNCGQTIQIVKQMYAMNYCPNCGLLYSTKLVIQQGGW